MTYIYIYIWLVVWNMKFIFPNSWDDDPNLTNSYCSEGLKPLTRYTCMYIVWLNSAYMASMKTSRMYSLSRFICAMVKSMDLTIRTIRTMDFSVDSLGYVMGYISPTIIKSWVGLTRIGEWLSIHYIPIVMFPIVGCRTRNHMNHMPYWYWLVVWNICFHILEMIIPTDKCFSEGLKPPTAIFRPWHTNRHIQTMAFLSFFS